MRHLLPAAVLFAAAFFLLAKRFNTAKAYYSVSWIPVGSLLISFGAERWYGFGWFTHVMFHLAYDTSYLATLSGILLVLIFDFTEKVYRLRFSGYLYFYNATYVSAVFHSKRTLSDGVHPVATAPGSVSIRRKRAANL
jgi:hypothetical protein